jgi:hypothetical protein
MNLAQARDLLERARSDADAEISAAPADDLAEIKRRYLGKGSPAARVNEAIKELVAAERPLAGQAVSAYKAAVRSARRRAGG